MKFLRKQTKESFQINLFHVHHIVVKQQNLNAPVCSPHFKQENSGTKPKGSSIWYSISCARAFFLLGGQNITPHRAACREAMIWTTVCQSERTMASPQKSQVRSTPIPPCLRIQVSEVLKALDSRKSYTYNSQSLWIYLPISAGLSSNLRNGKNKP